MGPSEDLRLQIYEARIIPFERLLDGRITYQVTRDKRVLKRKAAQRRRLHPRGQPCKGLTAGRAMSPGPHRFRANRRGGTCQPILLRHRTGCWVADCPFSRAASSTTHRPVDDQSASLDDDRKKYPCGQNQYPRKPQSTAGQNWMRGLIRAWELFARLIGGAGTRTA